MPLPLMPNSSANRGEGVVDFEDSLFEKEELDGAPTPLDLDNIF
jgi:hypothetical protein